MTPRTVLLVDNDPNTRERIVAALVARGFAALSVHHGDEAKRLLRRGEFAAVVFDLQSPGFDGMAVLDFLQTYVPQVLPRVPLITGVSVDEMRALYPICTTLAKPVMPSRLVFEVERCIERASS